MNQIETTRRAMYSLLAELKPLPQIQGQASVLHEFEQAMEDHLEALRKEIVDVRAAEASHDQAQEVNRVLKAQVDTLLCELDEARADRSKYRQWMRSAVRQNRAERQNVKAYRETQDELVAQIARLQRELAGRMGPERPADDEFKRLRIADGYVKAGRYYPPENAPQEPKQ